MTIERVPNHDDLEYYLISYDKSGVERSDDSHAPDHGGLLSGRFRQHVESEPITDIFFLSHGWKGDVPAAIRQYELWTSAMADCTEDRREIRDLVPGFRPALVGLHWPSRPWGDEEQDADDDLSFDVDTGADGVDPITAMVEEAANSTADTPRAKTALRTIFLAADDDLVPDHLTAPVVEAYEILEEEMGLAAEGVAGAPGEEGEPLTPEERYQLAKDGDDEFSFGIFGKIKGTVLSGLGQLSFWRMKKRARTFGEGGAATLLRTLQRDTKSRGVRFHLMGHSFGCIVMSGMLAGKDGEALVRPVDSAYLVQGALSYWAYCDDIPAAPGKEGYFHRIVRDRRVLGPLLTTQSEHDTAVGKLYPLAAGIKRQVTFDALNPVKYGALGTFGARGGAGFAVEDLDMLPLDGQYDFDAGKVYNIDASNVINEMQGASGAHNDIGKPEVGHAFWAAVKTAIKASSDT